MEGQVTISIKDYEKLKEDAKGVNHFREEYDRMIHKALNSLTLTLESNFDGFTSFNCFRDKATEEHIKSFKFHNFDYLEPNFWKSISLQEELKNEDC